MSEKSNKSNNLGKQIILDLSDNSNKIFTGNSVIQKDILQDIESEIERRIKNINNNVSDNNITNLPVKYKTILVSGMRGAGKTSFLFSLRNRLENGSNCKNDLEVLDFLDPTLIEEKAHIFFTIISLVKSKVEQKFKNCSNDDNIKLYNKRNWEEKICKLAEGLPFVDNVSPKSAEFWDDATQILNKSLDDVNSAFYLRKNFDDFLKCSLKILDRKVFLLTIDDIDTKFDKAWSLLETIRKYLATNYIITVLSGDFELFSIAIRKQQWLNFGNDFVRLDSGNSKKELFEQKITELESQYIEKTLPIENRYFLRSFKDILENRYNKIIIKFSDDSELEYRIFYESIYKKFGLYNRFEIIPFGDVIETFPTRTQISLLRIFKNDDFDENQFLNLFVSYFTAQGIRISDLRENSYINIEILKFLIKINSLDSLYQVQPIDSSKQKNVVLFVLNFLLCFYMNNKKQLIFDNMLRIGYVRNLFSIIKFKNEEEKSSFIEKVGLFQTKTAKVISGMILAELYKNNIKNDYGSIYLKNSFFDEIKNSNLSAEKKAVALLPAVYLTKPDGKEFVYSFYNLIAILSDILEQNINRETAQKILSSMAQVRSYIVEEENANTNDDKDNDDLQTEENEEKSYLNKDFEKWKTLGEEIKRWREHNIEGAIAVHILNKVSTRIFYSFKEIQKNNNKPKQLNTFIKLFNLFICQLFNACIIEEYNEAKNEIGNAITINYENLEKNSKSFETNLSRLTEIINDNKKYFPLTCFLISCPILLMFVDTNLLNKIKEFLIASGIFDKNGVRNGDGVDGKPDFSYYENNIFKAFSISSGTSK